MIVDIDKCIGCTLCKQDCMVIGYPRVKYKTIVPRKKAKVTIL